MQILKNKLLRNLFLTASCTTIFYGFIQLYGFEQPLFFRAAYFPGEPRFEKEKLSSFDLIISNGKTSQGRNCCGKKTSILDIYGTHNMYVLAKHAPKSGNDFVDTIVANLANISSPASCFADLSFTGKFCDTELIFNAYQNFVYGFFAQLTIPVHLLAIRSICLHDCSHAARSTITNHATPEWQEFLNNFDTILGTYGLIYAHSIKKNGLGDTSFWVGWTRNYQETEYLDFVDSMFKLGILFPTGCIRNEDILFDVPLGYNGHYGAHLAGDVALGAYEWLTIGAHIHTIVFGDRTQNIRVKNAYAESGNIKFLKTCARIHKRPVWEIGAYIKIDHVPHPLSFLFGYCWDKKQCDTVYPNEATCAPLIANTDCELAGWSMHTFQFMFEYDLAKQNQLMGPRLALFINIPVSGKNIYCTTIFGFNGGLDLSWKF